MSCSPETLKDYLLGELSAAEEKTLQQHLTTCGNCQDEWDRLHLARTALLSIPDEEPPRRTAFVSDKVFAPNWWQRLWNSGPQLGFVSAGLVAAALLAHGLITRPVPVVVTATGSPDTAMVQAQVQREVDKRLKPLIAKAVADSEARTAKRDAELVQTAVQEAEHRLQTGRRVDLARAQETFDYIKASLNTSAMLRDRENGPRGEGEWQLR